MLKLDKPLLLFDGDCGFCEWSIDHLRKIDQDSKFQIASYQSIAEEDLKSVGLDYEKCEHALQLIGTSGKVHSGIFAFNHFLLRYSPWNLLLIPLYLFPPFLLLEHGVYRAIANNRFRLSQKLGLKACSLGKRRKL